MLIQPIGRKKKLVKITERKKDMYGNETYTISKNMKYNKRNWKKNPMYQEVAVK